MSSSPLGGRFRPKHRTQKRVLLKPSASSYIVQVRLPTFVCANATSNNSPRSGGGGEQPVLVDAEAVEIYPWAPQGTTPQRSGASAAGAGAQYARRRSSVATGASALLSRKPASQLANKDVKLPLPTPALQDGMFAESYRQVVHVTVPIDATALDIAATVLHVRQYTERRPEDFVLLQCFADFTIDFSKRAFSGDFVPVKDFMDFPFLLTMRLSPYIVKLEHMQETEEPTERTAIVQAQRRFFQFAHDYAEILRKCSTQYAFLLGREREARLHKQQIQQQHYFDTLELLCFRSEKRERSAIAAACDAERRLINCEVESVRSQYFEWLRVVQEADAIFLAEFKRFKKTEWEHNWLCMLSRRFETEIAQRFATLYDATLHNIKGAYTESRIYSNLKEAQGRGADPDQFRRVRIHEGVQRNPQFYEQRFDLANANTLLADAFTSTICFDGVSSKKKQKEEEEG